MSDISESQNEKMKNESYNNFAKSEQRKNEIIGILISAWGLLSVFALFTNKTGIIGNVISQYFYYLFGEGAYLIPFLLIISGYYLIRFKKIKINTKVLGFIITFIISLALIHTYRYPEFTFRYALLGNGGGVIGGSISWIMLKFLDEIGSFILLIAFLLIGILLWFNILLKPILHKIEEKIKKLIKYFKTNKQNVKSKDNIDIKSAGKLTAASNEKNSYEENDVEEVDFYNFSSENEEKNEEEQIPEEDNRENKNEESEINIQKNDTTNNNYTLPDVKLLESSSRKKLKLSNKTELLEDTLKSFGVEASVIDVNHGPTITRYEVQPASGVKVSKIVNLANDIALALAAPDVRIEAPIPGKAAVGIEVPHNGDMMVRLKDIIGTKKFKKTKSRLTLALGKGIDGNPVITDLAKMPHLLIAGATGSGKSICINTLITSLLYKSSPEELKLILVDPKKVELSTYKGLPHLFTPVVTDPKKASNVLKIVVNEMEKRYELFSESGTRGIHSYNKKMDKEEQIPYIVVIIDELSDLMMVAANEVEDNICRLAQMSRAAGIHLIIATQRPSVDVITGLIKANIPSRISFAVSSQTDSRTILDMGGAEKLLGKGDMLFAPVDASKPKRIQGAFISDKEINQLVNYAKNQADAEYEVETDDIKEVEIKMDEDKDELYEEAVKLVVNYRASISMLQRRLHIGHSRAARMIDTMEEEGIVGPYAGSKPREVLIEEDELQEYLNGDMANESEKNEIENNKKENQNDENIKENEEI